MRLGFLIIGSFVWNGKEVVSERNSFLSFDYAHLGGASGRPSGKPF
jgi:hypothetical protein